MLVPDSYQIEDRAYFLTEAQDLLQTIEQTLADLQQERTTARIHELMRAAHTLKGAAASVGQRAIQEVSHVLEEIFRALYNPNIPIDAEVEALLFEGYECLCRPVAAALHGETNDDSDVMNRAAGIIARLQEKFGDAFNPDAVMPSSVDLGFDMVQSMFEVGVTQRLGELQKAIQQQHPIALTETLQTQADMFLGFAESLNLPGFGAIAQTTLDALAAQPDQVLRIAHLALEDFSQGREQVLAGDRTQGGSPSAALQQFVAAQEQGSLMEDALFDWEADAVDPGVTAEDSNVEFAQIFRELEDLIEQPPDLALGTLALEPVKESALPALFQSLALTEPPLFEDGSCNNHQPAHPEPPRASLSNTHASIRVELEPLKQLNHVMGELLVNQNRQTTQDTMLRTQVQTLLNKLQRHQQTLDRIQDWADQRLTQSAMQSDSRLLPRLSVESRMERLSPGNLSPTARLSSSLPPVDSAAERDRYNGLQSLVQTALIDVATLETTAETLRHLIQQTRHTTQAQQRLLAQSRDDLTTIRMAPLAIVFNRFAVMLQRLAQTHRKPVNLQVLGGDVLVDKAIADKLYDPLLHLVRNAFDHGIEPCDMRRAKGKAEQGQIHIKAYHQGRHTIIEVSDDGKGIDLDRVRQQVLDFGLSTAEALSCYSDSQVLNFLFEPGFSTQQQVSDLSGRGMGLDIVRSQIIGMQGSVQIHSRQHQGTTFILQLPISLTISKMLVCRSGHITYALPVQQIERILLPQPHAYKIHAHRRAVQVFESGYERLIPLRSLTQLLTYFPGGHRVAQARQLESCAIPSAEATHRDSYILLLQHQHKHWALEVEQILSEQELVVQPLEGMTSPDYVYGGAILGDNDVALALDPNLLFESKDRLL